MNTIIPYQIKRNVWFIHDETEQDFLKLFRDSGALLKMRVQQLTDLGRPSSLADITAIHIMTDALAEAKLRLGKTK